MLDKVLQVLAKQIEENMEGLGCSVIYGEIPDAGREGKSDDIYIKPISVQRQEGNRRRNSELYYCIENKDDDNKEVQHRAVDYWMCRVDATFTLNLHRGIDQFVDLLPKVVRGFKEDFNFSLILKLGDRETIVSCPVKASDDNIPIQFPTFENEADSDRPQVEIDFYITNVPLILKTELITSISRYDQKSYP